MPDETAVFALKIDADKEAPAEAAAELEKFRAAIEKSNSALASYRQSLRLLKGSSTEVVDAKAKLKAAIAAEQGAITKSGLGILKLGGSFDKLNKAHKTSKDAFAAGKKAIDSTGGPLKDISEKLGMVKSVLSGASSGWGLFVVAAVAGIAVLVGAAVATANLAVKLAEFTFKSADALRNMQLMREASSGGAANATAWGHQIDFLALKLSLSKDELNEMVVALEKSTRGTRVSGNAMVDTFQAVASASAAMGKDTGKALEDIITRGKNTGRFGISFKAPGISELQGTGITFAQVSKQLAKDLNIGLDQAQRALLQHRVTIAAGAKAVREVVETQLGGINAKKLISLDSIFTKLSDNARDWAQDLVKDGGALEPLLKGLKSLVDLTGLQTESGQQLKKTITEYATALSNAFVRNLPLIKSFLGTVIDIGTWFVHLIGKIIDFSQTTAGLFLIKSVLAAIAVVVGIIAISFIPLIVAAAAVVVAFVAIGAAIYGIYAAIKGLINLDWAGIGHAIVDGITNGLKAAWEGLKNAVTAMGHGISSEFRKVLGISSPSKVFAGYGRMTGLGYAQGITASQPAVETATVQMIAEPRQTAAETPANDNGGSSPQNPSMPSLNVKVEYNISGMGAERAVAMLKSPSHLADLSHALQTVLQSQGIPTGVAVASGG